MRFNVSEWALRNRQIVLFLMLLLAIVGALSYTCLLDTSPSPRDATLSRMPSSA